MDEGIKLDHLVERMDEADDALRRLQAQRKVNGGNQASAADLLQLYDQLIDLLEFKQVLMTEQSQGLGGWSAAGEDPRLLGLQLDRLRARRRFWAALPADGAGDA